MWDETWARQRRYCSENGFRDPVTQEPKGDVFGTAID